MLEKQPTFKNSKVEKIVPEFCVDTSVLIELYAYYMNDINHIEALTNTKNYSNYQIKFLKLLKQRKIKLYIPSEALIEFYSPKKFKDFTSKKRFLEDMGFMRISFGHANKPLKRKFFNIKSKLVSLYTNELSQQDKENLLASERYQIQNKNFLDTPVFNEKSKMDAKIMAEAVILGVPLITLNKNHFTRKNRPEIIAYLNNKIGGISHLEKSKPILPNEVFTLMQTGVYPSISHSLRLEMYGGDYPLNSFAFCTKRALNGNVIKLNKLRKHTNHHDHQHQM